MASVLALVFVVGLVVAVLQPQRGGVRASAAWPVAARPVMSKVECILYARLVEAFPGRLVLSQVQLCRFVDVRPGRSARGVLNRYDRLSADFVLCRPDSTVDLVVELDDSSHASHSARVRDVKKDAVLKAAGIRIVRLHVRSLPSAQALSALLFPARTSA